jgi:hypothetical protein
MAASYILLYCSADEKAFEEEEEGEEVDEEARSWWSLMRYS